MELGHGHEYALRLLAAVAVMPEMPTFTHATQATQKALSIPAGFPFQWVGNYAAWCEREGWLRVNRSTSPHTYSITDAGRSALTPELVEAARERIAVVERRILRRIATRQDGDVDGVTSVPGFGSVVL